MNMQNLMAQAQKMSRDMKKKKDEIDNSTFEGTSEWIKLEINGKKEIQKVTITFDGVIEEDDKEILADMIKIAFNKASALVDKEIDEKMGAEGSLFGGLF